MNRVLNYFIESENNIKSEYSSYGNIFNGLVNSSNLLTLNNTIRYYLETVPFVKVILNSTSYFDNSTIALDDIVYLYNSTTINSSDLVGIFKVTELDTSNISNPHVKLIYIDYEIITGLEFSISKVDNINDNAYLFKDNDSNKYIQIAGNILDETKYVFKIVNDVNYYTNYSSSPDGVDTTDNIETDKYIWLYSSSNTNFYSSSSNLLGKVKLSIINPNSNATSSDREYIFFI